MDVENLSPETEIDRIVKDYILQKLEHGEIMELSNDESLISSRILNSFKILQLRGFLEQTFDLTIYPAEVIPSNFETIAAIQSFVLRKSVGTET